MQANSAGHRDNWWRMAEGGGRRYPDGQIFETGEKVGGRCKRDRTSTMSIYG